MTISISVVTCAHNPRPDYVEAVTAALRRQTLDRSNWEYVLIDNASRNPLAELVDLGWHENARHVREEKMGLTAARLRGIQESLGATIVFVDDDNVLDPDYLENVAALVNNWPMIGAFSGQVRPSFEQEPPSWTQKYWNRLAIREFDRDRWSNIPMLDDTTPNGAGLCVARKVATEYARYHTNGMRSFVLDRSGESLLSAGDLDLATTACDLGLGNGLFASLRLTHLMPAQRLEEPYLLRLLEDQTFSAVVLESFRRKHYSETRAGFSSALAARLREMRGTARDRRFNKAAKKGLARAQVYLSGTP
ncbi:MAG TPA: glycosyltransferase [Gemmatimonadaceae bacterium]|nr:glycosyltransferase [Gemmatimonadaceae bacterium]